MQRESIRHRLVLAPVILSGAIASPSEAIAESKDPYLQYELIGPENFRNHEPIRHGGEHQGIGVLRLHLSIRKRMERLRSG